ncbi:MAG: type II toxin-antitoxin system prevent-host-death family antitoxin [Euzebyaceae bacterium]|jgi:prevent-host-death family protein|nr:type II toxin-antitoxin system prevent-host-death family antitoxin [Euzebyaceae bacterium]
MATVSIRDLRNHGGDVVDRVAAGERITVTRSGTPVAELRPLRPAVSAAVLIQRRARLPQVDPDGLRADIDAALDSTL